MNTPVSNSPHSRWRQTAFACLLVGMWLGTEALAVPEPEPHVGMESRCTLLLPRPDLKARPFDKNAPLLLRVESVEPETSGLFRYKVAFTPLQPGTLNLSEALLPADGSELSAPLPQASVSVRSLLPDEDTITLAEMPLSQPPLRIPYLAWVWLVGVLWVEAGIRLFVRPKPTPPPVAPPETPPPTLADRLRPLVELAAAGQLDARGQASLERLLIRFWSTDLSLEHLPHAERMRVLRASPDTGALFEALDRWMHHRQPEVRAGEVASLLARFANQPAPEPTGPSLEEPTP